MKSEGPIPLGLVVACLAVAVVMVVACSMESGSPLAPSQPQSRSGVSPAAVHALTVEPPMVYSMIPGAVTLPDLSRGFKFYLLDTDHDGYVTKGEWRAGGLAPGNFDVLDVRDPFGKLDFGEFNNRP